MLDEPARLFGSSARTSVLVAVRLLGDTYPSELAELLGLRLFSVQKALETLERESIVTSRLVGRTRQVSLNPRYSAYRELEALLWKLGARDLPLQQRLGQKRRRPRRAGKPLA